MLDTNDCFMNCFGEVFKLNDSLLGFQRLIHLINDANSTIYQL